MSGSIYDLLRDIRSYHPQIRYHNGRGTTGGRPCIWRRRFVDVWVGHGWISFIYENWPRSGTYQTRSHCHREACIDPVTSVAELWQVWERLKAEAVWPPHKARQQPERLGQLDLLDLIGAS